jgi:alanyl-tRNA synthetase
MLTSQEIKDIFINYFIKKKHQYIPGSSLVPNDSSLMFTNAGMNQFKNIFLGDKSDLVRVCNYQNCVRVGGKHNDFDDVGKDSYHHTLFEMLGNWSFNDYFKEEAIFYAWDLLVNVYKIDPDRLYVTYFGGNDECEQDTETLNLWKKYFPDNKILPFDKDNFWEMGDVGPCGPCTEIHYSYYDKDKDVGHLVNKDDPQVIEIWNLVFIQYNTVRCPLLQATRNRGVKLEKLNGKFVDTGMGFERLVAILQNGTSNYDTDIFRSMFDKISEVLEIEPYVDEYEMDINMYYRIVVDHIRSSVMLINDGVTPGANKKDYVLRKIIRRMLLNIEKLKSGNLDKMASNMVVIKELVLLVTNNFKIKEFNIGIIEKEEQTFLKTIRLGKKMLKKMSKKRMGSSLSGSPLTSSSLTGEDIHKLNDTYGLPKEIIHDLMESVKKNI